MNSRVASIGSLAAAVPGSAVLGDPQATVNGIVYDSRQVRPGDLFAALRGTDFDGHAFVGEAARRGAAAFLVEAPAASRLPQIVSRDSRAALAALSAAFYGHPSQELQVIGVTGTDGKTTTTFLIDHLLRAASHVTGMVGTVAIRIGEQEELHATRQTTPESNDIQSYLRQMVTAAVNWAILEATSHGLAMHRLDGVRFRIGAITNITHEHLDFHGSVENYRRAKAILLERVGEQGGVVVVNIDDPGCREVIQFARGATILRYGVVDASADVRALNVRSNSTGSRFDLAGTAGGPVPVDLPLIGDFNIANAVCAACVALAAGMDLETIASALQYAPPVPGRMAHVQAGQPFSVIVDYAHTPDSMTKVLGLLRRLHPDGRLITVFGSAGERDVEKRTLQGIVAAKSSDLTVVTSEDPRGEDPDTIIAQIAGGATSAGAVPGRTLFCRSDRRDAIRLALALAKPTDCVLLAGKGHEGSIIWGREKLPWDEAGVARELLQEAGYSR